MNSFLIHLRDQHYLPCLLEHAAGIVMGNRRFLGVIVLYDKYMASTHSTAISNKL